MRILALTNLYPRPGRDLTATFNRQQFRALAATHELRVIAPVAWHEAIKDAAGRKVAPKHYYNDDGIEVDHPKYYYAPRVASHRYGQFYLRSVRSAFQRAVREFQPEVLLACWADPDGWAAVQLAGEAGLPLVTKVIGSDVLVLARRARRRERVSQAVRQANAVVAVSRDLADHVERLGADPRLVHVVPEGIDCELFSPGDRAAARARLRASTGAPRLPPSGCEADEKSILFVGNLLVSKGAGVLIDACRLLRDRGLKFRCDLIGQGRDEPRLQALVKAHGLREYVKFRGKCAHERLPDWYRACAVVALPSFSEGIPNVLREAMACGRPFVATRVGGIPEVAHPSYSRLVASGDALAAADALAELLAAPPTVDPALVRERNLSWEDSAEMLAAVLAKAKEAGNRSGGVPPCRAAAGANSYAFGFGPAERHGDGSLKARGDRLRVLAITNQYPRLAHDGVAAFNRQQFRELAAEHDLRVVAPLPWPEVAGDWLRFDSRPRRYRNRDGIWVDNPCFWYPPKMLQHRHGRFFLRSVRTAVERAIDEFRPDVVLGCWAYPDGWAAVQLAREAGLPVVLKVHGSDVLVIGREPPRRRLVAEALAAADRVVAVSEDLARHVAALGVSPERVSVVRNGVDSELFSPGDRAAARERLGLPPAGKLVLFVGNILLSKGCGVLVEACRQLRERAADFASSRQASDSSERTLADSAATKGGAGFECRLVGQGRDARKIRALIARHKLGDCVKLAGPCAQPQLADWYRACDVVALPSFSEGVPNVLQEAIACGRPFVATRVGGVPEIAHPSFSRLASPGDAEELTDGLAAMLADPPVVDAALVATQTISWRRSAELLSEALVSAVGGQALQSQTPRRPPSALSTLAPTATLAQRADA